MEKPKFPEVGTLLIFKGTHHFFFPSMGEAASKLTLGHKYTLKKIEVLSSWVPIEIEEFPGETFPLSFFDYAKRP